MAKAEFDDKEYRDIDDVRMVVPSVLRRLEPPKRDAERRDISGGGYTPARQAGGEWKIVAGLIVLPVVIVGLVYAAQALFAPPPTRVAAPTPIESTCVEGVYTATFSRSDFRSEPTNAKLFVKFADSRITSRGWSKVDLPANPDAVVSVSVESWDGRLTNQGSSTICELDAVGYDAE